MKTQLYPEKVTPYLLNKLDEIRNLRGKDSNEFKGLARQYTFSDKEINETTEQNEKHYEARVQLDGTDGQLPGIERLYEKSIVVEPTLVCLAHCRYCLRSNYQKHTLSEKQLIDVAKYCGSDRNNESLNEVLITGGDPLIIPQRLDVLLNALLEFAPNIKTIRIATRITTQDPNRVDENVIGLFMNKPSVKFELATQINHPVEFFPEAEEAFKKISGLGVRIYAQNVLLKGVNDDIDTLARLYNRMRSNNIEAHYLFHCIPMRGIHHFRTSIAKGLHLARSLTCSGRVSGRAKPMFAAMTDVGKVTFYDGVILDRSNGRLLLQTNYSLADRRTWNPSWQVPSTAEVDRNGLLRVWYIDGED